MVAKLYKFITFISTFISISYSGKIHCKDTGAAAGSHTSTIWRAIWTAVRMADPSASDPKLGPRAWRTDRSVVPCRQLSYKCQDPQHVPARSRNHTVIC